MQGTLCSRTFTTARHTQTEGEGKKRKLNASMYLRQTRTAASSHPYLMLRIFDSFVSDRNQSDRTCVSLSNVEDPLGLQYYHYYSEGFVLFSLITHCLYLQHFMQSQVTILSNNSKQEAVLARAQMRGLTFR